MATFTELQAIVIEIIQDSSFVDADIGKYLNRAVNEIAGGMQSSLGSFITPPLPDLFKVDTVETVTDAAYVSMPATFQRNLQFAANSNGIEIDVYDSMIGFAGDYRLMDGSGSVEAVVEQGGNLYYQKIPTSAATLTIHFFRLPVAMSGASDVPDGIPSHLQRPLLVNHASYKIYELIEDSIEGQGPNTIHYKALFQEALRTLELSIPADARSLFLGA